jgi:glycosyltransferase involved in cell wall biosynthesis
MELDRNKLPIADQRPLFSICIPAYNRARHLAALLDSILSQDCTDFEIVICEDFSPERREIASIADRYIQASPGKIRLFENEQNLGYDGNIRNLVQKANGQYCFFMGNDDLMCPGALSIAADVIARNQDVGFILRAYAWFDEVPERLSGEVRYFTEERLFAPGEEAITICFRRSGVISGYIVHRDSAQSAATDKFDGTLYYQMHLTVSVLSARSAVYTPHILVLCRNNEPPDFGNSAREKESFVPGQYTPEARLMMVGGALSILRHLKQSGGIDLVDPVMSDYANYFYPYVRDQLDLPISSYFQLYRGYASMGFWRYPMFHLYVLLCYCFKQRRFDALVKFIRGTLGRSPHFGAAK